MNREDLETELNSGFVLGRSFLQKFGYTLFVFFWLVTLPNAGASLCVLELNPALRSNSYSSAGVVMVLPDSLDILEITSQWDEASPRGRSVTVSHIGKSRRNHQEDDPFAQIKMSPFQLANYGMNRFFEFLGSDGNYFGRVLDIFDKTGNYDNDNAFRSLIVLVELMDKDSGESKLGLFGNYDLSHVTQNEQSEKNAYDAFEKRLNSNQEFNRELLKSFIPQPLIDKPLKSLGDLQTWALGHQGLAENGSLDFPSARYSNDEALTNWPSDRLLNWAVDLDGTFRLMIGVLNSDLASESHLFLTTAQKPALIGGYLSLQSFQHNPKTGRGIWHVNLAIDVDHFGKSVKQNRDSEDLGTKIRAIFAKEMGVEIQIHKILLARKIRP